MPDDNDKPAFDMDQKARELAAKAIEWAKTEQAKTRGKYKTVYTGPLPGKPPATLLTGAVRIKERLDLLEQMNAEIAMIDSGDKTVN